MPVWGWPVVVPVAFVVWWCFVVWLVGSVFGWGRLASRYPARESFPGTPHRFKSGKVGLANYSGVLTVGASADGLYLAVLFPFRPGHPPLFIPWADVTAKVVRPWLAGEWLEFRFAQCPRTVLKLPAKLGHRLAADANRSWADGEPGVG